MAFPNTLIPYRYIRQEYPTRIFEELIPVPLWVTPLNLEIRLSPQHVSIVTFSLNGSVKMAQEKLRQKGLRSYLSLKKLLDIRGLRKAVLFKLFDALVSPVASYSCQVWLPATHDFHQILESLNGNNTDALTLHLPKMANDPLERLHLSFLEWTLGINKYTSNAAVWGDTGRYPLVITHAKQYLLIWRDSKS